jgi:hypothetical protein
MTRTNRFGWAFATAWLGATLAVSCALNSSVEKDSCDADADCLNGYICVNQSCAREGTACPDGKTLCNGACVSLTDPATGCGLVSCGACPGAEEGIAVCGASGECACQDGEVCGGVCAADKKLCGGWPLVTLTTRRVRRPKEPR